VTGRTKRWHLYLTAASTGFRVSELVELTPSSFDLVADLPLVRAQAAYTKNRKKAEQPLSPDVAQALRTYLDARPANRRS
jgi:integrase